MKIRLGVLVLILVCGFPLCAGAGQSSPAANIAPSSGKKLCSALGPADFKRTGIPVTKLLTANVDPGDNAGAYCTYENKSGNVEFDIFYPAGNTPQEILATEKNVLTDGSGGKSDPVRVTGADEARINLAIPGKQLSAGITVRRKSVVFAIYIPATPKSREQLIGLAKIVLGRMRP